MGLGPTELYLLLQLRLFHLSEMMQAKTSISKHRKLL